MITKQWESERSKSSASAWSDYSKSGWFTFTRGQNDDISICYIACSVGRFGAKAEGRLGSLSIKTEKQ